MKSSIFIPKRIKVGFQERDDTYTKQLAYIIYYDQKGKLRKEASWNGWRDNSIDPQEFDNTPIAGFVLNKKVGGYAGYYGNFRQAYVRIYDPRGFEFEITVPNLLYILENTSSVKGKGLEGEFVYGWDGTDLVLIPTCSPDYIELASLNKKRFENSSIKSKDLKIGATYLSKNNTKLIYMGRFDRYDGGYQFDGQWFQTYRKLSAYIDNNHNDLLKKGLIDGSQLYRRNYRPNNYQYTYGCCGKYFFFYNQSTDEFEIKKSISGYLIDVVTDTPYPEYAELFDKMECLTSYSPPDPSKTMYVHVTHEEFIEVVDKWRYNNNMLAKIGGEFVEVDVSAKNNDGYICTYRDKNHGLTNVPVPGFDVCEKPNGWGVLSMQMIPVDLDTIFNKIEFFHKDEYLANGKFYRRTF